MTVHLHGLGHFHPPNEIDNAFLEGLDIGTNDSWIMERVGIRSRRTTLPLDYIRETRNRDPRAAQEAALFSHAEAGRIASEMAIERAGLAPADIGMVIAGSSVGDTSTPAEACNIARALGLDVPCLDVNSACTSFFAQIHVLSLMRPDALPPYVLLVVSEAVTRAVDYNDRPSAVLWGDGTAAAVVSTSIPGRARFVSSSFASRPGDAERVVVPRTGHFRQDGRVVQMFAIRKTAEILRHLRSRASGDAGSDLPGSSREDGRRLHFVGHQANLRMLEAVCREAEFPDADHHCNVEWYGNTAGAGSPSVLSMKWADWNDSDDVAVVGVGAGLSWSGYLLRFGEAA
jgi:3-oxoacyl-[acyl-carrier-protein] synthase-3